MVCKLACENGMKLQVMSATSQRWGCLITAIDKSEDSWMSVRKQVLYLRFYREPDPLEDVVVRESLDAMKSVNSIKGYVFSSSGFTNAARRFAENRPIELVDKDRLEKILSSGSK